MAEVWKLALYAVKGSTKIEFEIFWQHPSRLVHLFSAFVLEFKKKLKNHGVPQGAVLG